MSKKSRFLIIVLIVLIVLLLAPVVAALYLNQDHTKSIISSFVRNETGRSLTIHGDVGAKWSWSPVIYAEQVKIGNRDWARTPHAISIDRISISLSFGELIRGQLKVTEIELDRPQMWIEQNTSSGEYNLEIQTSSSGSASNRLLPEWLKIEEVRINDGWVFYYHQDRDWEVKIHSAKFNSPDVNQLTHADVVGQVENTPVALKGDIGSLGTLLSYQEVPVNLIGYVGVPTNIVSVEGVIQDLLHWHGLNLRMKARVSDLVELTDLFGFELPEYKNITGTWEIVQPETIKTMRMESINLESDYLGLQSKVMGEINQLSKLNEVNINFSVRGLLDKGLLSQNIPESVSLDTLISGQIFGDKKNLILVVEQAKITTGEIVMSAQGQVSNFLNDWKSDIPIVMKIKNLQDLETIVDFDLPATEDFSLNANLTRRGKSSHLEDIKISGFAGESNLIATGSINDLGSNQKGTIKVESILGKSFLTKIFDNKYMPLLEQTKIDGNIVLDGANVAGTDFQLLGKGRGIEVFGTSRLNKFSDFENLEMDLQIKIDDLKNLESVTDQLLPKTDAFEFTAKLYSNDQRKIGIKNISGKLDDPSINFSIQGSILDLGIEPLVDLELQWKILDESPIKAMYPEFQFFSIISDILPISGQGRLTNQNSDGSDDYRLDDIKIVSLSEKIEGELTGFISNLFEKVDSNRSNVRGTLAVGLSGQLGDDKFNPSLLNGNINTTADIIFSEFGAEVQNMKVRIDSEHSTVNAAGNIRQFSPLSFDNFSVDFDVDAIKHLVMLSDSALNLDHPVKGSINLGNNNELETISIKLAISNSDLAGDIVISHDDSIDNLPASTKYQVNLFSENFDLTDLLIKEEPEPTFFSRMPLNLDWVFGNNAEIQFNARHFKSSSFNFENFISTTNTTDNTLISSVSTGKDKESLNFDLTLNKRPDQLNAKLNAIGDNIDFSVLTELEKTADENSGIFAIEMNLDGTGSSYSEIAATANGSIAIQLGGAKVKNDGLELIGGDLFLGLLEAINPLTEQDRYLGVECGVISFEIENGIATTEHGIALKTDEVTLLGGGEVDFSDESLKLIITPKARKGLGINTSSIAKMVRVGGTMKKPEIEGNPKGFFQTGVVLGAAIASGGLTLLAQGLFDKSTANSDVCRFALNDEDEETSVENVDLDATTNR